MPAFDLPTSTRLVVDNSNGADSSFAAQLADELRAGGFEVDVRHPSPTAFYDTSVHIVADGIGVRVPDGLDRATLSRVTRIIRASEQRRPERKRFRAIPVYRGETSGVLRWVDIFDEPF